MELLASKMVAATPEKPPAKRKMPLFVSPESAAAEKAAAGESLAVEHIAELSSDQQRKARARVTNNASTSSRKSKRSKN